MAAAAKKRKAEKEEHEQGPSRKKVKKEPSEQGPSAAQKTESASSQKSKRASDKNNSEEQTEECFRQAALGLRSLSGDLEGMPSAAVADSESSDKDCSAVDAVRVKEEKVDNGYEDSSKAVSDCSLKDEVEAKDGEVDVKFEPVEEAGNEDEDSDDADILLKIQKQCATIQSRGGVPSKNFNHVTDAVAGESFQMTEPSSQPEAEVMVDKKEKECEQGRECEPLNNQWSIVSEVAGIKTEPLDECSMEKNSIKVEDVKEEKEMEVGVEKVEPKHEPVETSDKPNSTAEGSRQLQISGVYSADAALLQESADRMTAATALTAVGQPLVGQPPVAQHQLVVQLPVQPSTQSLTQTSLAPAAQTLIQLASSSPAQQIVLTSAIQGAFIQTHQNPHQVLRAAAPPHSQAQTQVQVQPQAQAQAQAQAPVEPMGHPQPHQLMASSAPASSFLQDSDLQAEEAAAFEVLAEWSSMSAAHQQMSSSTGCMMDDERTNDSVYSSSSNEDSSNSINGAYNGKGCLSARVV